MILISTYAQAPVTLPELLKIAKESGVTLNQRTLKLYSDMGLLPRPEVRSREEGGRSGYYCPRVVPIIRAIHDLQQQGYSLRDVKGFLDRLESIARQSGRDPIEVQVSGMEAMTCKGSDGFPGGRVNVKARAASSAVAVWRCLSGPVVAEMMRQGISPDAQQIDELFVTARTRDGREVSVPVFLDLTSLDYANPTRDDDPELAVLTSDYAFEITGKKHRSSAASVRDWLEKTYDMSRANFFIARRGGTPTIGFAALGVEPERIRAGQVRLEGPYVVPQYRGQGLGMELMTRIQAHAASIDAKYIDAFVESDSQHAISFLRHCGFSPDHFLWEAHADVPPVLQNGKDPLADKSRMRDRLTIRSIASRDELEQAFALEEQAMKGVSGYYRPTADDLVKFGTTFPMDDHFAAYLDGEFVGTVWNSVPSPRVYAVTLPRYKDTWIETALWRHILRHLRSKGVKVARTEAVSEMAAGRKTAAKLGFAVDRMVVCYRKQLDGR